MGVWIETWYHSWYHTWYQSHPAWVCGLKLTHLVTETADCVTPCVGVWIETISICILYPGQNVTPCVGVWIETRTDLNSQKMQYRHTLRGCVD